MANSCWKYIESPFHAGELAIQARLGTQERMDRQGRRVIRDYLTTQHQEFFAQLSYVIVGTVDSSGHPWASVLVGEPGFLSSPDEHTLQIAAKPLTGDPLSANLASGIDIGLLGIELHTRRRNRLNGTVIATDTYGFTVQVAQSFGNCPQYIQARLFEQGDRDLSTPKTVHRITALGDVEQAMITEADTFFIATAYQDKLVGAASGVDVSHRGGNPGFVRIDDSQTLTVPDFSGNNYFNTFGNLELNPYAGLLFIDFNQGNLLYLTGTAEVIWEGAEINTHEGAERLLRFQLKQGDRVDRSLPLRWSAPEFSLFLDLTDSCQVMTRSTSKV
jgi:uncharacterized protein